MHINLIKTLHAHYGSYWFFMQIVRNQCKTCGFKIKYLKFKWNQVKIMKLQWNAKKSFKNTASAQWIIWIFNANNKESMHNKCFQWQISENTLFFFGRCAAFLLRKLCFSWFSKKTCAKDARPPPPRTPPLIYNSIFKVYIKYSDEKNFSENPERFEVYELA